MSGMDGMLDPRDSRLAQAWETLQAQRDLGLSLDPESNRLAFADPEFLLRRETRGIRFQLELLKPDLAMQARGIEHTIVVFGSARYRSREMADQALAQARAGGDPKAIAQAQTLVRNAHYYEQARAFGAQVAQRGALQPASERLYVCTGGGPGIMEAANRGANEAGGVSIGLNIALPHEQQPNPYITPGLSFKFHYFALRKMHFMMRAKALVAFPGGFGTLDELFETLTLVQCKKARPVPIVLFGTEHWKRLLNLHLLVEEGAISPEDLELFKYVDTVDQAWDAIKNFYGI
jgi:uncharacterized protein (TIGR00730 family)